MFVCNSVGRNTVQQPHSANTWAQSKLLRPSFNQQVLSQKVCCCVAAWLTCCLRTVPLPDLLHRYAANRTSKNITIELSKATFARFGTLQYGKTSFNNQPTNKQPVEATSNGRVKERASQILPRNGKEVQHTRVTQERSS